MKKNYHPVKAFLLYALLLIIFSHSAKSQCVNCQIFESFNTATPTAGGTWETNSVLYDIGNAKSGANNLVFNGVNDHIRTPLIANPKIFSFWYKRSTNTNGTQEFTIETSPNNTTWTSRGTISSFTTTHQQYSIDLSALSLTNIYIRIRDTRSGQGPNAERYIDDISVTSTIAASNLIIPAVANCAQTISSGNTYTFTDSGGMTDTYDANQDYTITFTPSVGTNKVQMVFSAFATEAYDGMVIYNGPTTAAPIISSGLGVGSSAANCPAGSFYGTTSPGTIVSSHASGSITIRFRSDSSTNLAGWAAAVSCITVSACTAPTQASAFVSGTRTTSTTAATFSGSANGYLVIRSLTATAPSQPVNGTTYSAANISTLGTGLTFIQSGTATAISNTALTGNTRYYYFVYAYNNLSCSGGPTYNTSGPLTGNMVTCPATPNNTTPSGITTTGFTLNWTAPTGGSAAAIVYTIQVSTDATFATNVAGSPFTVNAPTTTLNVSGLSPGTTYYYRIKAANGCDSNWIDGNILTNCTALPLTYTEGFNTAALPTCTTVTNVAVQTGSKISFVANSSDPTASANEGARMIRYNSYANTNGGAGSEERLRSAAITTVGTASVDVEFDWFQMNGSSYNSGNYLNEGVMVQWSTNGTTWNNSTFFPRQNATASAAGEWSKKTVTLPAGAGNQPLLYIGLKFRSEYGYNCYADHLVVKRTPTCLAPNLKDAGPITATTATINWAAATIVPASGYQYVVSTSSTTPTGSGTPEAGLSANVIGLTANTTYYVFVRSNCGSGDFSDWSTPISFYTGYCTVTANNGTTRFINNFTTTGGTANINNSTPSYIAGYNDYTAMSVSQQPYGSVNFSTSFTGGNLGFNIYIDWNNDMDFNDLGEKVYQSGTAVAGASGTITVPGNALVGNHRMRIRASGNGNNPAACGNINNSETEDYTFTVLALPCSGNPSNLNPISIGITTATIGWTAATPAPANGYDYYYSASGTVPGPATVASGSSTGLTAVLSPLLGSTFYNVWIRSNCGGVTGKGVWIGPITFTTNTAPPITTGANVCQGSMASISATATCTTGTTVGTTIIGGWDAATDQVANRPEIFMNNSPICAFDPVTSNYTTMDFQVSVTGSYTFAMEPDTGYDGMGYIVVQPFTPGSCGGTWIVGDDDGGGDITYEAIMTATLNAGTTYTLISTVYSDDDILITDTFQWNIAGPTGGAITTYNDGVIQWYTAASGGTPIATGTPFNPVGVAGSGITDTNTPGTTTFYAACSETPDVRTATNFVIKGPSSAISGSGSACSPTGAKISIALTGTPPWNLTYTDGSTPVTVTGITVSPYEFFVSPDSSMNYTVTAITDADCTGMTVNNTGTAHVTIKNWVGGNGNWNIAANWTPNGIPSATDCVVIPNNNSAVVSGSNYNALAGSVKVKNGGALQIATSNTLSVTDAVNIETGGTFNILDSGSLVQINETVNSGIMNMERITKPIYRYDYTYWSSPLRLTPNYTLGQLSPLTRADKFYSWTPSISGGSGNWGQESIATVMQPGRGYIVRAPDTFSTLVTNKTPYTANLIGTPNNGQIGYTIGFGTLPSTNFDDKYNLLGNPYPSNISALAFLNLQQNKNLIDGTIYFWTHNSDISASNPDPFYGDYTYNYNASDYASWNLLGGVGTAAGTGGNVPNGFITSGQAFFTRSLGVSGNVLFTNAMRTVGNNNQFFKNNNAQQRLWLNLIGRNGSFNQILVGYDEAATTTIDWGYDGVLFSDTNATSFYSTVADQLLVIQGRPLPFDQNDRVPLGYSSGIAETYTIRIDHFDESFTDQDIFIEDKLLDVIHNLKTSPYEFVSNAGNFGNRFDLIYTNTTLDTNHDQTGSCAAFVYDKKLHVSASENIKSIEIYDMAGKWVTSFKLATESKLFESDFNYAEGIYLAKIQLQNGNTVHSKLLH